MNNESKFIPAVDVDSYSDVERPAVSPAVIKRLPRYFRYLRELLRQGKKPTEVFSSCGYQDYSTFYRAYLQFFGYSPKELHRLNEPQGDRTEIV
jgi:methylphosphotriester-DNA--protein-cysteine methyltransferase